MILDSLENCAHYYGVHPRLREAFEYLASVDLATLEAGRYEIAGAGGEDIYMNVMEGVLKPAKEAPLEVHNEYIDIQVFIEGALAGSGSASAPSSVPAETMGWRARRDCQLPTGEFDRARDVQFFADVPQYFLTVHAGQFVLFGPEDAHAPMIGCGPVKKAVVKVKISK